LSAIDFEKIINVIATADVQSPAAKESAAELVEAWIAKKGVEDADRFKVIAVECGFHVWLDAQTVVVGVTDAIFSDGGIIGGEWKSTKGPSQWWNETKWLRDIGEGPQIATYALAQQRGKFFETGGDPAGFTLNVTRPRILVRAACKTNPVQFWPESTNGIYEFSDEKLDATVASYLNKAAAIRAMRKSGKFPWEIPGKHCAPFGDKYICANFEACTNQRTPQGVPKAVFDPSDPASVAAVAHLLPSEINNPDLVILSSSSYQSATRCMELYRLTAGAYGAKESNLALDTGSAMHAGLAEFYRQLKEGARFE
jgi:hypothetical protein